MTTVGDDPDAPGPKTGSSSSLGAESTVPADTVDALLAEVAHAPSVTPALAAGTVIDSTFRVERKLGAGGMGVVYLARDLRLNRDVALKLHSTVGAEMGERALREAKVMARLSHPHVITVYEVGTYQGRLFIAMEYLDGGTLRGWLRDKPRRWNEVLDAFLAAARGLAAAHDAGLVHRDFKPDNVLIGHDGRVRVADFGLARAAGQRDEPTGAVEGEAGDGVSISTPLTATGARAGTPAYMSPEQRRGEEVGARSDQYSFCVALREALDHVGDAPRWVRRVLARGVSDDPANRWDSLHALIARIERRRTRGRVVAGLAAAVAIAATASIVGWRLRSEPSRVCAGSRDRLRGVWDGERARGVRAGVGPTAAKELDRYVEDWVAMHREACEATRVHGDQTERMLEARMDCLERGRAHFDETVAILATDRAAAANALASIDALPSIAECAHPSLTSLAPPPSDPEKQKELAALREEMARVGALYAAGKYREGQDAARHAAEWARRLGYAPVHAEAAYYLGWYRSQDGQKPEAETAFREALRAAIEGGADAFAVKAAADLAHHLTEANRLPEADWTFSLARALLVRMGGDEDLEGHVIGNYTEWLRRSGRFDQIAAASQRTLEIRRRRDGPDSWRVGQALLNVAVAHGQQGEWEAAKRTLLEAHSNLERNLGAEHPLTLNALARLAPVHSKVGEYAEAERVARGLLAIETRMYGEDDPRLVTTLDTLAVALHDQGKSDEALAIMERAVAMEARSPSVDRENLAELYGNLVIAYYGAGKLDKALDAAKRSLEVFENIYDPNSPHLVKPTQFVGTLERYNGRNEDSLRTLDRAATLARRTLPADHPERLNLELERGMTLLALGRAHDALVGIEPAAIAIMKPGGNPANAAEARFTLARALRAAGRDRDRARSLAEQARKDYTVLGEGFAAQVAEIDAWLAERK